jgi:hypothetical protein
VSRARRRREASGVVGTAPLGAQGGTAMSPAVGDTKREGGLGPRTSAPWRAHWEEQGARWVCSALPLFRLPPKVSSGARGRGSHPRGAGPHQGWPRQTGGSARPAARTSRRRARGQDSGVRKSSAAGSPGPERPGARAAVWMSAGGADKDLKLPGRLL